MSFWRMFSIKKKRGNAAVSVAATAGIRVDGAMPGRFFMLTRLPDSDIINTEYQYSGQVVHGAETQDRERIF